MSSVSERWNRALMARDRDPPGGAIANFRYAILSTPRSGSTLLARSLEATGRLGVPHEYLNPNALAAWQFLEARELPPLDEYLQEIEGRRTSPSGRFGIKVHYRQFVQHYGEAADWQAGKFLQGQDRLILSYRRDKLAQAVSYHRARVSGVWSSEHAVLFGDRTPKRPEFDAAALEICLREVEDGERAWRRLLAGRSFLPVALEDLIRDYTGTLREVLAWLGCPDCTPCSPPTAPVHPPPGDTLETDFRRWRGESV